MGDVTSLLTFDLTVSLPPPPCADLCPVLNSYLPSTFRAEVSMQCSSPNLRTTDNPLPPSSKKKQKIKKIKKKKKKKRERLHHSQGVCVPYFFRKLNGFFNVPTAQYCKINQQSAVHA